MASPVASCTSGPLQTSPALLAQWKEAAACSSVTLPAGEKIIRPSPGKFKVMGADSQVSEV
jgi:hypothetical protein